MKIAGLNRAPGHMSGPVPLSPADGEHGTKQVSGGDFRKADIEAVDLLSLQVSFPALHPSSHKDSLPGVCGENSGGP